ncbi:hypothetical protein [Mycobacterium sp. NPDC050853]|uniref:hypothetical protein n=1 Tax=Mycobacteriaceae TaxID=1762 RepID=UPI0015DD588E|nr:hypothetical protein [Mycobacteroides sp. LB1]
MSALVLAVVTLPFSLPVAVEAQPEWVQLTGLAFLAGSFALNLVVWRRATNGIHRRTEDVRRLRAAAAAYLVALIVLTPLPATWQWLWFTLTILAVMLGAVSTWRLWRSDQWPR